MNIVAPVSGVALPLEAVPDEVFARRMVGDGAAIDPTSNEVVAPFAGTVSQVHQAKHAVAIKNEAGLELLIHVGLETVSLQGRGFEALVSVGQRVQMGQVLLRFDADVVARSAKSLITVVVVTTLADTQAVRLSAERLVTAGRSSLFTLEGTEGTAPLTGPSGASIQSPPIRLPNPNGLHARPAAVLASRAKHFEAHLTLRKGHATANLKSVVSVMALSTRQGDEVVIEGAGADARAAVEALSELLRDGAGEASSQVSASVRPLVPTVTAASRRDDGSFEGVAAAPGLVVGRIVQLAMAEPEVAERGGSPAEETTRLDTALSRAKEQLTALIAQTEEPARRDIVTVQLELLDDPELLGQARAGVSSGQSAAYAWRESYRLQAKTFAGLDQPLLQERAVDVRDVGTRVLQLLTGGAAAPKLPENAIVVAEELTPTQLAAFPHERLRGVVTTTGSATSHVSIIARGMGVPSIVGVDGSVRSLAEGVEVVLDGTSGVLELAPAVSDLPARAKLDERLASAAAARVSEQAAAKNRGQTRDGVRIEVVANIKNLDDARQAIAAGAEGVGLLRSEFMFFDREQPPSEDEQAEQYRAIAAVIGKDRPLVVRTLDVGGDKPLPYLPLPHEGNPFLGVRGIRVSLDRPELFRAQLRAILRAAELTQLQVMFPMISGVEELRAARGMLLEEKAALERQRDTSLSVKIGIMVEVPSAVVLAEALAEQADFFSIGTNDLTQYALAMDRGHPQLAKLADALHPAVLRLIHQTVQGARVHRRPVHLCGGIASDALAAPLLVGLGITELSVSSPSVGSVKAALARWSKAECDALAQDVLQLSSTAEVRALLKNRQPGRLRPVSVAVARG